MPRLGVVAYTEAGVVQVGEAGRVDEEGPFDEEIALA